MKKVMLLLAVMAVFVTIPGAALAGNAFDHIAEKMCFTRNTLYYANQAQLVMLDSNQNFTGSYIGPKTSGLRVISAKFIKSGPALSCQSTHEDIKGNKYSKVCPVTRTGKALNKGACFKKQALVY